MISRSASRKSPALRVIPGARDEQAGRSPDLDPERQRPDLPSRSREEPTLDDSQLLSALRRGDPEAAGSLYDRLRPVVLRTIGKLLGPGDSEVDDLAQQAMLEIVTSIERFRGESSLDGWASTIAAHVVFKFIRRRKTERRLFDAMPVDELRTAAHGSLQRESSMRRALVRVQAHLSEIDDAKAFSYVLHDVCGYDLKEVAAITGATVAAAQTRLVRGRRELHERISRDEELSRLLQEGAGS